MLPKQYEDRMQAMLLSEYEAFEQAMEHNQYKALRVNPKKASVEAIKEKFHLNDSVIWEENGLYYEGIVPGKHPYHEAGVYYIQEPSAMAPVPYLDIKKSDAVLDLCAAPGGKSTQIAAGLSEEGLLVANEIHPQRAKILSENIERLGVPNAIVTNETPDGLSKHFNDYFDKILVDAPCSGEGMFRKNELSCQEWSPENVKMCADRQDDILEEAIKMLKPGGRLVYSTCTFAPDEDEGTVARLLKNHPDMSVEKVSLLPGMSPGVPEWAEKFAKLEPGEIIGKSLYDTIRLWPHKVRGEGHFLAVLKKAGSVPNDFRGFSKGGEQKSISEKKIALYREFEKDYLKLRLEGVFLNFADQIYLLPKHAPELSGLKVRRAGLHLGEIKKDRFEPSHALALYLKKDDVKQVVNYSSESLEVRQYLNGQALPYDSTEHRIKGWALLTVDNYSLGFVKAAGGMLKNHYPKGLRKSL